MPPASPTLWAMYLQATRLNTNSGKIARKQWIMLPPLPEEVAAKHGVKGRDEFLQFHREQTAPENRVKWRYTFDTTGNLVKRLPIAIREMLEENTKMKPEAVWKISPVITAQITPKELSEIQAKPQTPYALLRRFEKVAAKKHGLSI